MTENTENTERYLGRVKWFNSKRGFGFVTNIDNDSGDIFVHHSGIISEEDVFRTLYNGEYVSYSITVDEHNKQHAVQVRGVNSGPLMCETQGFKPGTRFRRRGPPRIHPDSTRP